MLWGSRERAGKGKGNQCSVYLSAGKNEMPGTPKHIIWNLTAGLMQLNKYRVVGVSSTRRSHTWVCQASRQRCVSTGAIPSTVRRFCRQTYVRYCKELERAFILLYVSWLLQRAFWPSCLKWMHMVAKTGIWWLRRSLKVLCLKMCLSREADRNEYLV